MTMTATLVSPLFVVGEIILGFSLTVFVGALTGAKTAAVDASVIAGEWCYLYRAVDRAGRTVDFRLSAKRDVAAAKAFFRKAIKGQHDAPRTITLDGYAASHRAVRELKADGLLPAETKLRSSKYLNNLIEQDHRGVKQRIATMLGFKGFATAAITIAGIELMHRIRKGQFGLGRLGVQGRLAPAVWNAVLQA